MILDSLDENNKFSLEVENKITKDEENYKKSVDNFFDNLLNEKYLTKWSFEDKELVWSLNEEFKEYFNNFSLFLFEEDNLTNRLIQLFISDVKLSVLRDEAILISKKVSKKENNDRFRLFFDTLSDKDFFNNKVENLETIIYLKSLEPLVKLTLINSKKRSSDLIERFNGFKLINANMSKTGKYKVYEEAFEVLSDFIFSFKKSKNNALCITLFDESTNFLDIHYLAKKIYNRQNFELCLEILISIKSPLMKNMLIDSYIQLEQKILIEFLMKSLKSYNQLFERSKQELRYFLDEQITSESKKVTVYTKVDRYGNIYNLLGEDENYEELLEELKFEMISVKVPIENDEEDFESVEWVIQKIFGRTHTYKIEDFGKAYDMLYKEKNQK